MKQHTSHEHDQARQSEMESNSEGQSQDILTDSGLIKEGLRQLTELRREMERHSGFYE